MLANIFSFLSRKRTTPDNSLRVVQSFKDKYHCFRNLLESNAELLQIIAELQEALDGDKVFGAAFLRSQGARTMFHASRMVKSLQSMSGGAYPALETRVEALRREVECITGRGLPETHCPFVMPYASVNKESVDCVGGKNANLGEMAKLGLPIPSGFAISTSAFTAVLEVDGKLDRIRAIAMDIDPQRPQSVQSCSEEIQHLILGARVPDAIAHDIHHAFDTSFGLSGNPGVALRSSAIGEDSELSFAGQYLSILNVHRDKLLERYTCILASLFTPRAISYRLFKGVPLEDAAMSVACLEMVASVASGVMYSRHPFNPAENNILINAVWGLGPYAVDGVVPPDTFIFSKDGTPQLVRRHISQKPVQLCAKEDGGVEERLVPPELVEAPCLNDEHARQLAIWAKLLEEHYGCPQDTEWALDANGRLVLLQTRPLALDMLQPEAQAGEPLPGYTLLLEGGDPAYPGVGSGPVFIVDHESDLESFPQGAVLVARHSSPKYVVVLQRAAAVVTDSGSVTGHMASLAREFRVPSLLQTHDATSLLRQGQIVTVDAWSRRVYQDTVPELLQNVGDKRGVMLGTPIYSLLESLAQHIVPLNLTNPKSAAFTPANCRTVHDVMRFIHERSYDEMFSINDMTSEHTGITLKLRAPIPLDLYVIDLGGGVRQNSSRQGSIAVDDVLSTPFSAILQGMLDKQLTGAGPRPVHLKGFFSVLSEQMLAPPNHGSERFGDKSYALISDKYLNFSSRVGYHYGIIDAYCGQTINKNYVNFEFKGGAADTVRRNRRARAIGRILQAYDFSVEATGDRVVARFQKYETHEIEERLQTLGRLLIFTRQMDMLMQGEQSVEQAVNCFLRGCYDFSEI